MFVANDSLYHIVQCVTLSIDQPTVRNCIQAYKVSDKPPISFRCIILSSEIAIVGAMLLRRTETCSLC